MNERISRVLAKMEEKGVGKIEIQGKSYLLNENEGIFKKSIFIFYMHGLKKFRQSK